MKNDISINFPLKKQREGKIHFFVPNLTALPSCSMFKAPVFYNPRMELNRDIAVLALRAYNKMFSRPISVCEPLTGCGVRGIRYAKEVKGVIRVVINDLNKRAFNLASYNVEINGLHGRINVQHGDANNLLCRHGTPSERFNAIDIDPFGCPTLYLDAAIRALRNKGLLALTATDMAPLCGVHPKACVRKYGGKPLRTGYCHELALRLLAGSLATTALKYDIGVNILFSHSTDHYIRVYSNIHHGAKKANASLNKLGYVLHCFTCLHREIVKDLLKHEGKCSECNSQMGIAGPMWLGKLSDSIFCDLMNEERKQQTLKFGGKIATILDLVKSDSDGPVTYYRQDKICKKLNLPTPPLQTIIEILTKEGYSGSLTHFSSKGIKSNASAKKIKEILKLINRAQKPK